MIVDQYREKVGREIEIWGSGEKMRGRELVLLFTSMTTVHVSSKGIGKFARVCVCVCGG